MINRLIGGFVGVLIGVSLLSPIASETVKCSSSAGNPPCYTNLSATASWAPTVLGLVPGFFALGILGIGLAITYGALSDAGVV
jgi:hypothetical protein